MAVHGPEFIVNNKVLLLHLSNNCVLDKVTLCMIKVNGS